MFSKSLRNLTSDFAHKQVTNGFSKKYGENFDRIFGGAKTRKTSAKESVSDVNLKETSKTPNSK